MENHKTLLFRECDPILIFECIRLKSKGEKIRNSGQVFYDEMYLNIALPTKIFREVARLFCQRSECKVLFGTVNIFKRSGIRLNFILQVKIKDMR